MTLQILMLTKQEIPTYPLDTLGRKPIKSYEKNCPTNSSVNQQRFFY